MKKSFKYIFIAILAAVVVATAVYVYKYNNVVIDVNLTPEQLLEYEAKVKEFGEKLQTPDPEDPMQRPNLDFFLEKAKYEYYLGRLSSAIRTLDEGLQIYPATTSMLHNKAKMYEAMGRYKRAIDMYQIIIDENGNKAYYIEIARAARTMNDVETAKNAYWEYQKNYNTPDTEFENWLRENNTN